MHQARMPPRCTIAIVHDRGGAPAGKATAAANVNAGATRGIAANTPPPLFAFGSTTALTAAKR